MYDLIDKRMQHLLLEALHLIVLALADPPGGLPIDLFPPYAPFLC